MKKYICDMAIFHILYEFFYLFFIISPHFVFITRTLIFADLKRAGSATKAHKMCIIIFFFSLNKFSDFPNDKILLAACIM